MSKQQRPPNNNDEWQLVDTSNDNTRTFNSEEEAREKREDIISLGAHPSDLEIRGPSDSVADRGEDDMGVDVVDHTEGAEPVSERIEDEPEPVATESDGRADAATGLAENPIEYLRSVNDDFVNEIKGTEAISKTGLRYLQYEHDITTESEIVAWSDDPYGVIVWAKAELPDGRSAEAHGEGYPSESGIDDTQYVRYADTRGKSRAILELTSAGALAVDEVRGGNDDE